jgi:NAD(P)-dependent dehydrogenase (short-subunit alcohol dehydrogenase family)
MEVTVVTGAASGMGRATAERLVSSGSSVVGLDVDGHALAELAARLGDSFRFVVGDVSERASHEEAADAAVASGELYGWVNAAGIWVSTCAHKLNVEDFNRVMRVNLLGVALGCAVACERFLVKNGVGSIVNISSMDAIAGFPDGFAYDASKGAVDALTRQIAVEYGPYQIRCNAVRPGTILTALTEGLLAETPDPEATIESWKQIHPLGRVGSPEEVANVIVFLLSEEASYVT